MSTLTPIALAQAFQEWIIGQDELAKRVMGICSEPRELTLDEMGILMAGCFSAGAIAAQKLATERLLADVLNQGVH